MTTNRPEDRPTVEPDERATERDQEPPGQRPAAEADAPRSGNGAAAPSPSSRPSPVPRSATAAEPNGEESDSPEQGADLPGASWKPAVGVVGSSTTMSAGMLPPWQRTYGETDAGIGTAEPAEQSDRPVEGFNGAEGEQGFSPLPGLVAPTVTDPPQTATDPPQTVNDAPPEPAAGPPDAPAPPTAPVPPVPPVGGTSPSTGPFSTTRGRSRPPRQASLQLKRLDPWSVLKLALVLAAVTFFVWLVTVGVLYGVLDGMGVWDRLNGTYSDLVSPDQAGGGALINAGRVFAAAAIIGVINSVLLAVALTVGAFVYNVAADLVGGVELTLSERD